MLPWDDLQFWYIRSSLADCIKVIPGSARLMAMAMQFDNLHKIRAPLGVCQGLDLSIYDTLIEVRQARSIVIVHSVKQIF